MTEEPSLRLFGTPLLRHGAGTLGFRREQRFRLLGYLATVAAPVCRDRLAEVFWPDEAREAARRNLRKMLFDLRRLPALADSGLHVDDDQVHWRIDSDLGRMRAALAAGNGARAAACCGGELLEGLDGGPAPFQEWLDLERAHHGGRWRTLALDRLERMPDSEDDLAWSERLLRADALDERAMRAHVRALARRGLLARARRCHDSWRARMLEELGLTTADDFGALVGAARTPPAAPRLPCSAPQYLGGFVGRSAELAQLRSLLTGACRLVTVLGPPGMGKTRLAAEAFESLRGRIAARMAYVALDGLREATGDGSHAGELVARIAAALGLAAAGVEMSAERLAAEVGREPTLLLLDNFEHRLADLPLLAQLLRWRQTRLLVTSTVRLELDAEAVLALQGLALRDGDDAAGQDSDALRLFEARCGRLAGAHRADALALCQLLEGQPLAIELAARACRALPPAELLQRLRQGLDGLATAATDLPPRQRSLRAAFEAHWRAVPAPLAAALARLGVMPAGFSTATARAVAEVGDAEIAALVDHSLLRAEADTARLRWHPFVQRFAFEALAADPPGLAAARQRVLHHFVTQLQRLQACEARPSRAALRYLAAEADNLAAAWRHALALGDQDAQHTLAEALALHHEFHARCDEGAALLAPGSGARLGVLRARLLHWCAPQRAQDIAAAAHDEYAAAGDTPGLIAAARVLGLVAWRRGDAAAAAACFGQALALGLAAGLPEMRAVLLDGLGLALVETGDRAGARRAFSEALALNEAAGNEPQIVHNLINLALDARDDCPGRAAALARRALQLAQEIGYAQYVPHARITLSLACSAAGQAAAAQRAARDALAATLRSGDQAARCWAGVALALACRAAGDAAGERTALHEGLALAWQLGDRPLLRQHLALCEEPPAGGLPLAERVHEALGRLAPP